MLCPFLSGSGKLTCKMKKAKCKLLTFLQKMTTHEDHLQPVINHQFSVIFQFVRKNNKATQYRGYLDFVQEVGETCGFHVEEDSLRIPSTKRVS